MSCAGRLKAKPDVRGRRLQKRTLSVSPLQDRLSAASPRAGGIARSNSEGCLVLERPLSSATNYVFRRAAGGAHFHDHLFSPRNPTTRLEPLGLSRTQSVSKVSSPESLKSRISIRRSRSEPGTIDSEDTRRSQLNLTTVQRPQQAPSRASSLDRERRGVQRKFSGNDKVRAVRTWRSSATSRNLRKLPLEDSFFAAVEAPLEFAGESSDDETTASDDKSSDNRFDEFDLEVTRITQRKMVHSQSAEPTENLDT